MAPRAYYNQQHIILIRQRVDIQNTKYFLRNFVQSATSTKLPEAIEAIACAFNESNVTIK